MMEGGLESALFELAQTPEYTVSLDNVKKTASEMANEYPLIHLVTNIQLEDSRQIHKGAIHLNNLRKLP